MFDLDNWQEIFETIRKNKLRTFLTGFSVAWGIFMLIILLGFGSGLQNGVNQEFESSATNAIWFWRGQTSMPYKGMKPGRYIRMNNEDYEQTKLKVDGVEYISGRFNIWSGNTRVNYKNEYGDFNVQSAHPDYKFIEKVEMLEGRYINKTDIDESRKVVMISQLAVESLFKAEDPMGKYININNVPFKVVGLYTDQDVRNRGLRTIYVPISAAQKVFTGGNQIHTLVVTTGDASVNESKEIESQIRSLIAQHHKFDVKDDRALGSWNASEEYSRFKNLFFGIRVFIWIIGIGTLIAGIVGVSNIMIIVVRERTKEIGVRKAIGATPGNIVGLVLFESITITTFAGYIGLVGGVGVLELISKALENVPFIKNPTADIRVAITATVLLIFSGALAGFIPARRASRIKPIVALRDE